MKPVRFALGLALLISSITFAQFNPAVLASPANGLPPFATPASQRSDLSASEDLPDASSNPSLIVHPWPSAPVRTAQRSPFATAGASASLAHPAGMPSGGGTLALWLGICGLPAVVLIGRSSVSRKANARVLRRIALLCFVSVAITWSACGGGNGSGNGGNGGTGTPAGTYNLTVTGSFTSGSTTLTRKAQLTLVVQ